VALRGLILILANWLQVPRTGLFRFRVRIGCATALEPRLEAELSLKAKLQQAFCGDDSCSWLSQMIKYTLYPVTTFEVED
jgi:hypothetical protein